MQVGKAYFELVDYLEADRAFNLARQITPYSLEGMDIYSTVLYVSKRILYQRNINSIRDNNDISIPCCSFSVASKTHNLGLIAFGIVLAKFSLHQ